MRNIKKNNIILSILYNLRCLTFQQIHNYVYKKSSARTVANNLQGLCNEGLIDKIGYYYEDAYYQITNKGISELKKYGVISLSSDNHIIRDSILPASKIILSPNNVQHQLALNQFVLDFIERYPNTPFEYYDEKYISNIFSIIRPDGLIKTDDHLFFLELDMNTERESRLLKKWESYRKFIHSEEYYGTCSQDIKVLFILENIGKKSLRKHSLQKYIDINLRNDISNQFNLYVDAKESLFNMIDNLYTPSKLVDVIQGKGFFVTGEQFSSEEFNDYHFQKYIYKPDKNNRILVENNYTLDFIMEDYSDFNMYTYKKILNYPKINALYKKVYSRDIKFLIVVRDVLDAQTLIKNTNSYYEGIYFTTLDRLREYTLYSALFTIGTNGILYHFQDGDLRVKQEEGFINSYL